jgi:hypothetical protein
LVSMEPYLRTPRVNQNPEPFYTGNKRNFQGIPGIEITPGGRLWSAWYGGGESEDRHNCIMAATRAMIEESWSEIRLVIDPDGDGPVRAYDPCIWLDPRNRMWIFWAQGYEGHFDDRAGVWAIRTSDPESLDPEWTEPVRIADGIMMNKPTVLKNGEWLLPVAVWGGTGSSRVYVSADHGESFEYRGEATITAPSERSCDEHMIIEQLDGGLRMLVRTGYGIGESTSPDSGKTWSDVNPSDIKHPVSRFFIRRLKSGNLLLVKHGPLDRQVNRCCLKAYISYDDGITWSGGALLDAREGVSYPDGAQQEDGTIHIVYDYDRRGAKEIIEVAFTETEAADESLTIPTERRRLINKADG